MENPFTKQLGAIVKTIYRKTISANESAFKYHVVTKDLSQLS
jgi:hypothetical protein